ncbi:MAG TPA: ribosome recycling factor [bacterium]|nr:ribosome recycling factor [bacterium]HPT30125.1 ribosome recycling factor [bacterium]
MNQFITNQQAEFTGAIEFFKKDIASLRTGRANPALLENVLVDAYGAKTPLNGVGNIAVSDARSMTVSPWDKNVLKDIEKALIEANLGMGVVNEGDKIRITIPQMTEENRKDLVKKVNERQEKAKISIRQIREEVKQAIEAAAKAKDISEDDKFAFVEELDGVVNKYNAEIKEIRDKKEGEIMEI